MSILSNLHYERLPFTLLLKILVQVFINHNIFSRSHYFRDFNYSMEFFNLNFEYCKSLNFFEMKNSTLIEGNEIC